MRHFLLFALVVCFVVTRSAQAQSLHYEVAAKKWDANLGTHRAVVRVDAAADAVRVRLDWRRRDPHPELKAVIVIDGASGQRVLNTLAAKVSDEFGELVFQPTSGKGEYFVYFLPGKPGSGSFPAVKYLPPQDTASTEWKEKSSDAKAAMVVRWEARTEHDRFNEMEIIATKAERDEWLTSHAEPFFVFPEVAEESVRMFDHIPQRWLLPRPEVVPAGGAGEPLVFQLGVWAARGPLKNVRVKFGDLVKGNGTAKVPADQFRCFQLSGDQAGRNLDVPADGVLPLWCGVQIGAVEAGRYRGNFEISADGVPALRVPFSVQVTGSGDPARAYAEPNRLSKLFWLDSKIAENDSVVKPFTPLGVDRRTIHCLGRSVTLGDDGLPTQITSFFNSSVTKVMPEGREILASPIHFVVELEDETKVPFRADGFQFGKSNEGVIEWSSTLRGDDLSLAVRGRMEFDGQMELRCELASARTVNVRDVRLEIPRTRDTVKYSIGLGSYGGIAPSMIDWKWDVRKHQDALWLGSVNAGLRVQLRAENYARPMVNIHYPWQPLNDPPSWSGSGKGGIRIAPVETGALFTAFSGPRTLDAGRSLHFDFDLSVTPFKPIDTRAQWRDRYYQVGGVPAAPEEVRAMGANVINIHQGNALNPYINYPFLTADKLSQYATLAHDAGMRVKYYYTVRELTNWIPELFALRSFGDELLAPGKGGGHAWCEEHLGGQYWGAWYEPNVADASILTATMSRFHNFYLEGLDWLVKNAGCDGIYLDDISYDRTVMKRARRILDQDPRGGLIDLHSWNEMNERAGEASCSLIFMDSFPFVDRLWLGEGHHYDRDPEQTLIAVSGIPFGLMGEMLEGGGNPWLGLTFGMTGRLGWGGSPQSVWKLWDEFDVAGSDFIGWWDESSPVKVDNASCRATIWRKPGKTLISVGNFGDVPVRTKLSIDFAALGIDPQKAHLYAPEMKGFQPELLFDSNAGIMIAPKRGFVFILDESPRKPVEAIAALALDPEKKLFEDTFRNGYRIGWNIVRGKNEASMKPGNEGLVFLAHANTHAWIERPLPDDVHIAAAQIRQDVGDEAQQWGPGIALVWPDGKLLKVNRRKDGRFGINVGGAERLAGMCDLERPVMLAFVIEQDEIRIVANGPGVYEQDTELARVARGDFAGAPATLRVGKMPNDGAARDHSNPGIMGWSCVESVSLYR